MAFRRLKHKTQVFFAPENDHICTRIEHSLHVASIATTISKALGLNTDLAHAIGLGHDLGHAPFGHAGEKTLQSITGKPFHHELHSLRVVDKIENYGNGLNLTFAVRDGIVSHCGEADEQFIRINNSINKLENITELPKSPSTWEGCTVRISDSIAYLGRDLEDAVSAGLIAAQSIPADIKVKLGDTNSKIINTLVYDVIDWSMKNGSIGFSEEIFSYMKALKEFSRNTIYQNPRMKHWNDYSAFVIRELYNFLNGHASAFQFNLDKYTASPNALIRKFGRYIESMDHLYRNEKYNLPQIVTDYIAGMTDEFAIQCYKTLLTTGTAGI